MKRRKIYWLVVVLTGLAAALVTLVVIRAPHTVPLSQCSDLYRRYHDVPGIQASFIKKKQVNDTLFLDMTVLKACDSAGWEHLKKDFAVKEIPPELMQQMAVDNAEITLKLFPKNKPGEPKDTLFVNNDAAAISRRDQTIFIFHLRLEEHYDALVDNKTKELTTNNTNQ